MTKRTQEEIENHIKQVLEDEISPGVAHHGGSVNFISYENGKVMLELSGSCSGCAGSTMTLNYITESIIKEQIPEVDVVEGFDDPMSNNPFYTDPFMFDMMYEYETIDLKDVTDDPDN